MTTEQTAQQLELAAQILRTGHPFMASPKPNGLWCVPTQAEMDVLKWPVDKYEIRPILATPPDNRPLHNPDNLTAEQVGIGYRLFTEDEFQKDAHLQHQEWWSISVRPKSWLVGELGRSRSPKQNFGTTYRLPLSVPWPETQPDPYADEKKTVPLGPEDVKPFTVIRRKGEAQTWHWRTVSYVDAVKVTCGNRGYEWDELVSDYERNESLSLTGKWNPDAWEPCHKLISKNG